MDERRQELRHRTLRSGKIVFNDRRSVVDCLVRNLSDGGACLQVNTSFGLPASFDLAVDDALIAVDMVWATQNRIGVAFRGGSSMQTPDAAPHRQPQPTASATPATGPGGDASSAQLDSMLHAALDRVDIGIVLLDAQTRAQFINRAFRRMWRLADEKAESKPPFVALMYHGRDTRAYAVRPDELDSYVAARVAMVKAGDTKPIDLRLANGEAVRVQCTVLPAGGRMLCYTYVTDIVHHADELEILRSALDSVQQGVTLLDPFLNVQFMNRAVRALWGISDAVVERHPPFVEVVSDLRLSGQFDVPPEELGKYIAARVAVARAGDPTPVDLPLRDGRVIRSQCAVLAGGGRMITYSDVTDLVRRADQFEQLATIDGVTGLVNRRHFEVLAQAEWNRFQRYQRPLSLILIDIDRFKTINDMHGHAGGDRVLSRVAELCRVERRNTDIVARVGGDEFALLLPETDLAQAQLVARRLRELALEPMSQVPFTLSMGVAQASLSMSGVAALMQNADAALYKAKATGRDRIVSDDGPPPGEYHAAAE
ncbi:MAG TPA: diguanylate cyclase [Pseudolabrys sp.]|nr:diguanylate cyclase [Pseudolabrys sp.]